MILFTILLLTLILLIAMAVIGISVVGSIGIVIFGDLIVCIAFIVLLIKWLVTRKKK